jgi:hypothetical protein
MWTDSLDGVTTSSWVAAAQKMEVFQHSSLIS